MNRDRTNEKKINNYRTVTEIVDAENSFQKQFDVSSLTYQNEAYLRKMSTRQLYLMVAKYYVEVIKELNIPDIKVLFGSNVMTDKIFSLVYYSLAFVNNQMVPHNVQFVDMKFVQVKDRKMSIPTDPIIFYKSLDSEDQTITCYVDTVNMLRILEKPIDVETKFEIDDTRTEVFKLMDRIKSVEKKQTEQYCINTLLYRDNEKAPEMNEVYVTPFVTLLIIFSNAYLGLFKLMRSDFQQYYNFLLNHESLIKERSIPNINNLITGHFTFKITEEVENKTTKGGITFK